MTQKRKLDLQELELQLPAIDLKETKIILGGNDYGDTDFTPLGGSEMALPGDFSIQGGHGNGGHGNGENNGHDDDMNNFGDGGYEDQGELDQFYDDNNGEDVHSPDLVDPREYHQGQYTDSGPKHHFELSNLPSIEVQSALDCWMEAAEFLYEYFRPTATSDEIDHFNNETIMQLAEILNVPPPQAYLQGLPSGAATQQFVDHFFENEKINENQLIDALSNNQPVFAGVDSIHDDLDSYNHQVVIVGYEYDDNGNMFFICADSATGQLEMYPYDHINFNDIYVIQGMK